MQIELVTFLHICSLRNLSMRTFQILSLILLTLSSCKEDTDTSFTIDYSESFDMPATFGIELATLNEEIVIATESADEYAANNTKASLIKSAKLSGVQIALTSPENEDFAFIKDLNVYLDHGGENQILIGSISDPTAGLALLTLSPENEDLKGYLNEPSLKLRIEYTSDDYTGVDRACSILCIFNVEATVE